MKQNIQKNSTFSILLHFSKIWNSINILFGNRIFRFLSITLIGFSLFAGFPIYEDGHMYMEAAFNTLRGYGFVVNCNLSSVRFFQPLYAYAMIPFIYLFGYRALTFLIFHFVLFIVTFYIYDRLLLKAIINSDPVTRFLSIVAAIFPFFTSLYSESLTITLLGLYLYVLLYNRTVIYKRYVYLVIIAFAICFTRNAGVFILIPIHLSFIDYKNLHKIQSYIRPAIFVSILILIFFLTKIIFNSRNSHPFYLEGGIYNPMDFINHILNDFSSWVTGRLPYMKQTFGTNLGFLLNIVCGIIVAIIFFVDFNKQRIRVLIFLLAAVAIHIFVFYFVEIDVELKGRFIFWFELAFFYVLTENTKRKLTRFLYILIIGLNLVDLGYSRIIIDQTNEVLLKPGYELDKRVFFTDKVRESEIIKTGEPGKYMIVSPAYYWFIAE